jgi:carboxyl-terminal processing protease
MDKKGMVQQKRPNITLFILIPILALATFGFFFENTNADFFLKIYRGIDIYNRVYKEIAVNYVDTLDPEQLMRSGVDGMLKNLDPYTVFIGEKENDELDLVTTGRYGGIGVTIGMRDGNVTIVNLLEGFSAAKQGIEIGDRIIEIDGRTTKGSSLETVRQLVRGAPGTELKILIEREGENKPIEFVLLREEITVRNVAYKGYVTDGIGYIRLEKFSRTAGEDVRIAIKDLQAGGELKGLILDLRDNPGGLLESAVDVVSKFVPENSLVVSTRGRKNDSERKYSSSEKPMLRNLPLAVLVNRYSASASEIVGGAVQDMDRGIIVGTRTFGKGLVQTITRLSDNSSLKMTTARYYTPSGRCIQEIDYWHRDGNGYGTTVPDSLKHEFFTAHKRPVWESGGIMPDTIVADTAHVAFVDELNRKAMFFKYANHFASENKVIPDSFEVTNQLIDDFEKFLKEKGFECQEEGDLKLKDLRTLALNERYDKSFIEGIDKLNAILKTDKKRQIRRYQEEIRSILKTEILTRVKGDKARFESAFPSDKQLQTAVSILINSATYDKLLSFKKK